ncbi:tRNA pseudouridine(55) synthase TruB [Desulfurobacterium indicum]|uniref:tRNA pseudouridine synthase B n=1 Tax=Desulfurobacterium indicum TaxID=1914305 RepID=A0A1R1MN73_9BACT|nr:tRNA pseudouridine(55) synthase TruB [Desulfurobacterium indicum]OMH41272.1 tRNA pseudouridine(55) synthase TruB [Desulfurobacterium indicum]
MDGFLLIDKPSDVTSFEVVRSVRRLFPFKTKVGHTGTLDPLATGLLILSIGKATRFGEYLLKQDKCYLVTGRFGLSSDTYDIDGRVENVKMNEVSEKKFQSVISSFSGEIEQIPPPFSAVRINGKRAYELARRGEKVELRPRMVTIYSMDILSFSYPDFSLKICCSSGTYIRSLVHDIGVACGGDAVVTSLKRVSIGRISVENAVSIDVLSSDNVGNYIVSIAEILPFDRLLLDFSHCSWFLNGRRFSVPVSDGRYTVVDETGRFLGVGFVSSGILKPEKVISQ